MKNILWLLLLAPLSQYAFSENVLIEKFEENENLKSLHELMGNLCRKDGHSYRCSFKPSTAVKWGLGFCEDTKESLERRAAATQPEIYVNSKRVPENSVSKQYKFYERESYQHCYTWLIKLSSWKPGESVSLSTKNGDLVIDKATIHVETQKN